MNTMRRVRTHRCTPGAVLAQPVVNERGLVIVQAGVQVTQSLLDRLDQLSIWHVFVEDERFDGIEAVEPLHVDTLYRLKGYLRRVVTQVQEARPGSGGIIAHKELMNWVDKVNEEITTLRHSFLLYPTDGPEVDAWLAHMINVAVLSARTLRRIGGVTQARDLIAAAFLQDLGVWRIPPAQRQALFHSKQGEHVPQHVEEAQRIVAGIPGMSSIVKGIVAQHHERQDGSGYPAGRKGDEIHPLARVIGVVDDYLRLIRDSQQPLLPHEAVERLMAGVGFEYDHAAIKAFTASIPIYPIGMEIILNTGEHGVIVGSSALPSRPVVRVLATSEGELSEPYDIDLSEATTQMIVKVLAT